MEGELEDAFHEKDKGQVFSLAVKILINSPVSHIRVSGFNSWLQHLTPASY